MQSKVEIAEQAKCREERRKQITDRRRAASGCNDATTQQRRTKDDTLSWREGEEEGKRPRCGGEAARSRAGVRPYRVVAVERAGHVEVAAVHLEGRLGKAGHLVNQVGRRRRMGDDGAGHKGEDGSKGSAHGVERQQRRKMAFIKPPYRPPPSLPRILREGSARLPPLP